MIIPLLQHTSPWRGKCTSIRMVLCRHTHKQQRRTTFKLTSQNKYSLIISSSEHVHLSWVTLQQMKTTISFFTSLKGTFTEWQRTDNIRSITHLHQPATASIKVQIFLQKIWKWPFHLCISGILFFWIICKHLKNNSFIFKLEWFFCYFTVFY